MVTQQGVTTVNVQVQLEEGNRYTKSVLVEGVLDGAILDFYVENPAGSGRAILFDPPVQNATGKITVASYKNPTLDVQGTEQILVNGRFDQGEDSVANAYGGPTTSISGGTLLGETVSGTSQTGTSGKATAGSQESAAFLLMEGNSFGIQIENTSGSTVDIASAIALIEVPVDVIPTNPTS